MINNKWKDVNLTLFIHKHKNNALQTQTINEPSPSTRPIVVDTGCLWEVQLVLMFALLLVEYFVVEWEELSHLVTQREENSEVKIIVSLWHASPLHASSVDK